MSSSDKEKDQEKSAKKVATITIASKDGSGGIADPGPGDPNAAPSVAPELVDLPPPPTQSQLVVKSVKSKRSIKTIMGSMGSKSTTQDTTLGQTLASKSSATSKPKDKSKLKSKSDESNQSKGASGAEMPARKTMKSTDGLTVATTMSKDLKSGGSTAHTGPAATGSRIAGPKSSGPAKSVGTTSMVSDRKSTATKSTGPKSSGPKSVTSLRGSGSKVSISPKETELVGPKTAGGPTASAAMQADSQIHDEEEVGEGETDASPSPASSPGAGASSPKGGRPHGKGKKKVTKFRYHKRITVRTHGKTSPVDIMKKVSKKDHQAGITASTIEDMDPQELMRRAGIKGNNKTHWRVRLRQTKRLTKNGKTVTETKIAYRDSEGNKRIKTSDSPFCKSCNKKLEDCKCDSDSQQ